MSTYKEKRAAYQRKYYHKHKHDPKFIAQKKQSQKKYRQSAKGVLNKKKNRGSYVRTRTPAFYASRKRYKQTETYKAYARSYARDWYRKRAAEFRDLKEWKESQESFFRAIAMTDAVRKAI